MEKFDKTVPFDPGYSNIAFSFIGNIDALHEDYKKLKANHQKKFWLMKFEPAITDLIKKTASFYLGCMLWGGFIHYRFKDTPKEITGNNTLNLSETERQELDCAIEAKEMLDYIQSLDKDYKYFLKRPAKVPLLIKEILESYVEFAEANQNFINTKRTSDIKIPKAFEHFKDFSNEKLDELYDKINNAIESKNIEKLLEYGLYKD